MKKVIYVALCSLFLGLPALLFAAPLNPQNPYKTVTDDGGADLINVMGTEKGQEDSLVNVVKGAVNWILGILALIALLLLLWGGFQMVTSAGDEKKYEAGFTILKHAATGLILIGVAWFIISIVFRLVNQITSSPGTASTAS